jgi:hypothetical protein
MKRNCDKLREKALQAGMDSSHAAAWRVHCRSCPDCQTELFLLEALQRQSRSVRQHLGKRELSELLEVARQSHARRRRAAPLKAWLWRAASVCLLAGVAWHVGRLDSLRPQTETAGLSLTLLASAPDAACGNYGVPLLSTASQHDLALGQLPSPALPAPLPDIVPGQFVQELLLNLRDEVERRRQELLDLQDDHNGGWEPDDAWHLVLPSNLAAA